MNKTKLLLAIAAFFLHVLSYSQNIDTSNLMSAMDSTSEKENPFAKMVFEIRTFQNVDSTKSWGYDIFADGRMFIHQPHIPAFGGNKGFETELDAKKVAILVESKIKNNIMPPSVTTQEIRELGVLVK